MKFKGWAITLLSVVLMFAAVLGMRLAQRQERAIRADRLFEAGSFEAARELYLELEDADGAARCTEMLRALQYREAGERMAAGEFERAAELFRALGDYGDSAELARRCVFQSAEALAEGGEAERARERYLSLGDYPGVREALAALSPALYDRALELAEEGDYAGACELWREFGDYRDSAQLLKRGERALDRQADPYRMKLNDPLNRFDNAWYPDTYVTEEAYILFPAAPDRDTRFFLYIPGGRGEEIYSEFLYCYLQNPAPNTLSVILRNNDLPDMDKCCEKGLRILDEAAADCGLFMRELAAAGSSLGAYPALQVPRVADKQGVHVTCVLALDAGNQWSEDGLVPSFEQCRALAETGAHFYLFQPTWVDMDYEPIRLLVNTGNWVMLAGCLREDHEQITYDVMNLGVIAWALGDREGPCPGDIYSFRRLTPG